MYESLFGPEMPLALRFLLAFVVVLALIIITAWLIRRFSGSPLGLATTGRGRQPRLAVIDAAAVDGRRRLVLIRRDNVEHLLMIGGPSDLVVEPNIVRAVPVPQAREPALPPRPGAEPPLPRLPEELTPRSNVEAPSMAPETSAPIIPAGERPPRRTPENPRGAPLRPADEPRPARPAPAADSSLRSWAAKANPFARSGRADAPAEDARGPARSPERRVEMDRPPVAPRPPEPTPELGNQRAHERSPEKRHALFRSERRRPEPPLPELPQGERPDGLPPPARPDRDWQKTMPRLDRSPAPEPRPDTPPLAAEASPETLPASGSDATPARTEPESRSGTAEPAADGQATSKVGPPSEEKPTVPEVRPPSTGDKPLPAAPVRPPAPADRSSTAGAEKELASMAQRLEAALRRPPGASRDRQTEPAGETPARSLPPPAPAEPKPVAETAKPAPAKSMFDSLEEEMASLLGRPAGRP